jgi:hypothetical protein
MIKDFKSFEKKWYGLEDIEEEYLLIMKKILIK